MMIGVIVQNPSGIHCMPILNSCDVSSNLTVTAYNQRVHTILTQGSSAVQRLERFVTWRHGTEPICAEVDSIIARAGRSGRVLRAPRVPHVVSMSYLRCSP